jgi:hypothetical protein
MTQPLLHGPVHEARPEPVLALDVDGTLAADPRAAGSEQALRELGYQPRHYRGPGPDQAPVSGTVWLNPQHASWLRELLDRGMHPAWATSWGQRAADWIAPQLDLPPMPVVEVADAAPAWGWSAKQAPISRWAGDRPLVWIDDTFGGKEFGWAEDRTDDGIPTLLIHTHPGLGIQRHHINQIHAWLDHLAIPRSPQQPE